MAKSVERGYAKAQSANNLLLAPYDIRCHIYSQILPSRLHVYLQNNKLCLSQCYHTSRAADQHEPKSTQETYQNISQDRGQACRLISTWGSHWDCESTMLRARSSRTNIHDTLKAMKQTCKRLDTDVSELVAQVTTLIISDLPTLDALFQTQWQLSLLGHIFRNIKELHITIKPPMLFINSVTSHSVSLSKYWSPYITEADASLLRIWLHVGPGLAELQKLQKVTVWLDYKRLSKLDESAMLAPLLPLAQKSDVELIVDLPSQGANDDAVPPFHIYRSHR